MKNEGEKKGKKRAFKALFLILILGFAGAEASAKTFTVDSLGEGDYSSIQAAIEAASPEDTLIVNSGTYTENLRINKLLKIWSDSRNPKDTLIRAKNPAEPVIVITAGGGIINGFGISGSEEVGIYLEGVEESRIENNEISGAKVGLILKASRKNLLTNNLLSLNEKGLLLENSKENTIQKNAIAYNYEYGISLQKSSQNQIYNNYLRNTENVEERAENHENIWEIPISRKKNVIGGPFVSGNFWANPEGTGFSETCVDEDGNGLCDKQYEIMEGLIDKFPLYPKYPTGVKKLEARFEKERYEAGFAERERIKAEKGESEAPKTNEKKEAKPEAPSPKSEAEEEKENGIPAPGSIMTLALFGAVYLLKRRKN